MFFKMLYGILKIFVKKPELVGVEKVEKNKPAIFVSNHMGYYAPIKLMLFTDFNMVPWVIHEVTDNKLCANYLRHDFIEPTMRLRPPMSKWFSAMLAPICVGLMRQLKVIPVYHGENRIRETFQLSVTSLIEGRSLLIFPEVGTDVEADKYRLGDFQAGFLKVVKDYYEQYGVVVNLYPVYVDKKRNRISFGDAILYNPETSYPEEKIRLIRELREEIRKLENIG